MRGAALDPGAPGLGEWEVGGRGGGEPRASGGGGAQGREAGSTLWPLRGLGEGGGPRRSPPGPPRIR